MRLGASQTTGYESCAVSGFLYTQVYAFWAIETQYELDCCVALKPLGFVIKNGIIAMNITLQ